MKALHATCIILYMKYIIMHAEHTFYQFSCFPLQVFKEGILFFITFLQISLDDLLSITIWDIYTKHYNYIFSTCMHAQLILFVAELNCIAECVEQDGFLETIAIVSNYI